MRRMPIRSLVGLLTAAALLAPAAAARAQGEAPQVLVPGAAGARSGLASSRTLLAIATPASGGRVQVRLQPTVGLGPKRLRSLPARMASVRRIAVAVDDANATTVAWQGAGRAAYAATLAADGRLLAPVARVPLGPDMRLTGLTAGGRRTLLTASVTDLLQDPRGYCRLPGGQFAGATTFGVLKTARGRFARPTDTGTGDYAGGTAIVGTTALVADGSGDLAALNTTRPPARGRCTPWRARRTLAAAGIRSYAAIDAAADGTFAGAGLAAPGPYVGTGDEEEDPPTPAPQPLRVVLQAPGRPARTVDVGPGTAPAVLASNGGFGTVAYLDQPPAGAFGGGGALPPTSLTVATVGSSTGVTREVLPSMLADPSRAAVPEIVRGADGVVLVLEAAGRYRLSQQDEGGRGQTEDLGPVTPGRRLELARIGGHVEVVERSSVGLAYAARGTQLPG